MTATGLLGRVWALGCIGLFLLFWVPVSVIVFYSLFGVGGSIAAAAATSGLVLWARSAVGRRNRAAASGDAQTNETAPPSTE